MTTRSVVYIAILGIVWGLHFSVIRFVAESGIDYAGLLAYIAVGDTILLLLVCFYRKRFPFLSYRSLVFYSVCALLGYLAPFVMELFASIRIGAGTLTIVVSLTPAFTVLAALVMRSETVSKSKIAAVAFGVLSIFPLLSSADVSWQSAFGVGLLAAALVPLCYAVYHNFVAKYWPDEMDSWQVASGETVAASAVLVPFLLITGNTPEGIIDRPDVMSAIGVFMIFAVIEIYLYFEIVRLAGAVFVSQASLITVVVGVLAGMLFFGEQHGNWIWISAPAVCVSIYLAARHSKPNEPVDDCIDSGDLPSPGHKG